MKYQRFTPSNCKDVGIKKFEFAVKLGSLLYNVHTLNGPEFGELDYLMKLNLKELIFKSSDPKALQPDGANLWYFKLRLFYL